MQSLLGAVSMSYLAVNDYIADYTEMSKVLDGDIWKSECAQHFREPGNPSWEAFVAGRWEESVDAAQEDLAELTAYFSGLAERGSKFYRVRVVERPLTSYLNWELRVLRVRAQAGERVRIALPDVVEPVESRHGSIPELVILGDSTGYVVDYGADGTPRGAGKFSEADSIKRCRSVLKEIYDQSEDLEEFFAREVAPLGAPARKLSQG